MCIRRTSANGRWARYCVNPNAPGSSRTAVTEVIHGNKSTAPATVPTIATPTARRPATTSRPVQSEPTSMASATSTTKIAVGGKNAVARAVVTASARRARTRLPRASTSANPAARASESTRYGATPNRTSGPRRPPATALRATGEMP